MAHRYSTCPVWDLVRTHPYLRALTCGSPHVADRVLAGQNVGHGSQATDPDGWFGYPRLGERLTADTGQHVGVVGLDYEHDQVFTPRTSPPVTLSLSGMSGAAAWSRAMDRHRRRVPGDARRA